MVYLNPGGYDLGPENLDGYGISHIVFIVLYSLFFYSACFFTWLYRKHPVLRMRNVPLMLSSMLTIHVFIFVIFIIYTMNGAFPCQVEYWWMCLYLPIGIGLYQAYNQQLLIVSRGQAALITKEERFKPIFPKGKGIGGPKYWAFRFKVWWQNVSSKGKYEGFVFIGIIIQFILSLIIYTISRRFNHYGVVDHHTTPLLCRRGWEWIPTIAWQFLWNYAFGPYLLWNIRMIKDIYNWRLQTTLTVIAGLPGAPLWLAAIYSEKFMPVNKYWIPQMWFLPGLMTIEIVTLGFPIYTIFRNNSAAREIHNALADFDQKQLQSYDEGNTLGDSQNSLKTKGSTKGSSRKGKMYSMESLDACLRGSHDGLQVYASCMELNGENIIFLTKVINFTQQCQKSFHETCKSPTEFRRARSVMFRIALSIFISLVHSDTASYPINIESNIYSHLNAIFGPATALIASVKPSRSPSVATPISSSKITPWDDPARSSHDDVHDAPVSYFANNTSSSYPLRAMSNRRSSSLGNNNNNINNESSEHIVQVREDEDIRGDHNGGGGAGPDALLQGVKVPAEFDDRVFDAAFKSVRFMVWSETWQRYMHWRRSEGEGEGVGD